MYTCSFGLEELAYMHTWLHRAEKTTVPLLHGTFCSDMTSNISFVMFDTPYINGCLREKMHLKRCTVHHTVDPTTMRIITWTVRCAHIFCTGTHTVYIRTQVFLHADLSIVGRIRTSGHPGLSSWGLAAWQRLHKSQHHHLRCTGGYYPTVQNGTPGQKRNRVKQWDLREDESTWPMFGKVQQVMFGGLRLTQQGH